MSDQSPSPSASATPAPAPAPPVPLRPAGGVLPCVWCQRCLRTFKTNPVDAVFDGCQCALSKCDRCARQRHSCVPCPRNCFAMANDLVEMVTDRVNSEPPRYSRAFVRNVKRRARALDRAMLRSTGDTRASLPTVGAAPATPSRRNPGKGSASAPFAAPGNEVKSLILQATRVQAEVMAQAANILLPAWPEDEQLDYPLSSPESDESDEEEPLVGDDEEMDEE